MAGTFINYRTGDGGRSAELIDERLVEVFGHDNVFRDRRSMRPGTSFPEALQHELQTCTVLLALIGPRWLTIRDRKTKIRRIDIPDDYVRREIAMAFEMNKIVIPVLLDTRLPKADVLPPSIARLSTQQVQPMREGYSHEDLDALTKVLLEYMPGKKPDAGRAGKRSEPYRDAGTDVDFGSHNTFNFDRNALGLGANAHVTYHERAELRDEAREGENDDEGDGGTSTGNRRRPA